MPTVPVNRDSPFCYRPGTSNTPGMCSFHWGQLGIWKLSGIGGFQLERCAYHVKCWSSSSEFSQGDHQCNPTRVSSPRVVRCLLSFIHAYQDFYLRCIHIFIWRGLTSRCWEDAHSSGVVAAVSTDLYIYIYAVINACRPTTCDIHTRPSYAKHWCSLAPCLSWYRKLPHNLLRFYESSWWSHDIPTWHGTSSCRPLFTADFVI